MSVKQHEPMCFDSAQDRWWWMDHFLGDQLQDEWRTAGTGSAVVVDQQTGGIVRITTGALTGNDHRIDWNDIRSLLVTKRVSVECRCKISATTNIRIQLELRFDANNQIRFYYSTLGVAGNWNIETTDGGASTALGSGVAVDTNYHIFRMESHIHGGSHVHFYIDGVETNNSPINTNVPDDANDYLQPWIYIRTREDAIKSMDVDYCAVRQDR